MQLSDSLSMPSAGPLRMGNADKAAIIVRLLMSEDAMPRLTGLSLRQQQGLVRRRAALGPIDRDTLAAGAREFAERLDTLGLTFPGSLAATLELIGGRLSDEARASLAEMAEAEDDEAALDEC